MALAKSPAAASETALEIAELDTVRFLLIISSTSSSFKAGKLFRSFLGDGKISLFRLLVSITDEVLPLLPCPQLVPGGGGPEK